MPSTQQEIWFRPKLFIVLVRTYRTPKLAFINRDRVEIRAIHSLNMRKSGLKYIGPQIGAQFCTQLG